MSIGVSNSKSQSPNTIYGQVAVDPFSRLPDAICREILRFASSSYDLGASCSVSKKWRVLVRSATHRIQADEKTHIYQTVAFSKLKWNFHFGNETVTGDDFSSLPQDIGTILSSPCRAFPGKRIIDTHKLVYLPESINLPNAEGVLQRVPFTLNNLGRLMESKLEGGTNGVHYIWDEIATQEGDKPLVASRWVLMTKGMLLGSRGRNYRDQVEIVGDLAERSGLPYAFPRLLEAATCIYILYLDSVEKLWGSESFTFTRCEEVLEEFKSHRVGIGCFAASGLDIQDYRDSFAYHEIGIAAVLR